MPAIEANVERRAQPRDQHREHVDPHVIGAEPMLGRGGDEGQPDARARIDVHEERAEERQQERGKNSAIPKRNAGDLSRPRRSFIAMPPPSAPRGCAGRESPIRISTLKLAMSTHDRDEQRAARDERIVVALDGGEHRHAEARVAEDHLGDERAADHRARAPARAR